MGGLIALEAARQLLAAGQAVALVAMFDTYLSLKDFPEQDMDDQAVLQRIAPQLNVPVAELKGLPLAQQWDKIAELADKASGIGIAEIRRLAAACKAHFRALSRHEPRPYAGRCVLFPAQSSGHHVLMAGGLDRRWKDLCPELCIEPAPGDHFSMLREPHVQVLAERSAATCRSPTAERRLWPANAASRRRGNVPPRHGKDDPTMRLLLRLLRASWRTVLLAGLIGAASGAASVGLVALILHTLYDPHGSSAAAMGLFAALCVVILVTRIGSQMVLCRMTQANIAELRIGLCRRILDSPLKHLEEIGIDRMLGCLTGDVNLVSQAINGVPVLAVNFVVLACGAVYLGSLSLPLLACCAAFAVLGFASYWYSSRWAGKYVARSRQAQDVPAQTRPRVDRGGQRTENAPRSAQRVRRSGGSCARCGPREPVSRRHLP